MTRPPKMMTLVAAVLAASAAMLPFAALAGEDERGHYKHVLLTSVDGLHEVDLVNYAASHPTSAMAGLLEHGIHYKNASTATPSDSFPGLTALVTGATPKSSGVYYDDSYDRRLSPPKDFKCETIGTETVYAENLDTSFDDGLGGATKLTNTIDPDRLPRDSRDGCNPVYPHQFLRVNTIFNVAHAAGLYTAWSDKHPAYEIVRGRANTGAEDLYTPEINSPPRDLTCVATEGPGGNPDSCPVLDSSKQWTDDVSFVTIYDGLKVQAIINEIQGWDHGRKNKVGTPTIFGMNFQSVSVGQKLTADGYDNAAGKPSPGLAAALDFVDTSLGRFVDALAHEGLASKTLIVLAAKHGQSPIDISKLHMLIGGKNPRATNDVKDVTDVLADAKIDIAQATEDDVSLIWLPDPADEEKAVEALEQSVKAGNPAHIATIIHGRALRERFGDPKTDTRTPDLIVQPIAGVIYSGSKKKIAEHGGFAADDTHTALVLSSPKLERATVTEHVTNMQVAPTILKALGLNPAALDAVRLEGTNVLPEFGEE